MADPLSAAAAVAEAAPAALTYVQHTLNAPVRRQDLASDNRNRLKLVQQLLEKHLQFVDACIKQSVDESSVPHTLLTWRTKLQDACETCTQLSPKVASANQFSRVHRADQILAQVESTEREFSQCVALEERETTKVVHVGESRFRAGGTVPPNPPRLTLDYDSPDTFEGKLKAAVLEPCAHKLLAVVAAGRGGVGKTCALRGLNDVDEVRSRFPDGVQFIQLGKDAGMDTLTQQIAKIVEMTGNQTLGNDIRGKKLQAAANKAREWFLYRKCLFLVDDVWKGRAFDADTFYVLADMINEHGRLVYTTRDQNLAMKADETIEFGPRKANDSRAMFLKHAGLERCTIEKKVNIEALEGILEACGGIPLLLAVTGSGVREYFSLLKGLKEDALKLYHDKLNREPYTMIQGDVDRYGPVRNVTNTSISVLETRWEEKVKQETFPMSIRDMHRSLCVLQKQQQVPVSMLRRLWCLREETQALEVMKALNSVAIVEVTIPENEGELNAVLRVHDDILDALFVDTMNEKQRHLKRLLDNYLRGSDDAVDTKQNMICVNADGRERRSSGSWLNPKRLFCCISKEGKLENADERAVVGCTTKCKRREWWSVEDGDEYLDSNVCRLLKEAGEDKELVWLLLKPQWIIKRLKKGGIFAVENDVSSGKAVLDCSDMGRKEEKKGAMEVIAEAARLSQHAVAQNPREACFQLYGRLVAYSEKCETTRKYQLAGVSNHRRACAVVRSALLRSRRQTGAV